MPSEHAALDADMIRLIRSITDAAGLDAVPFLDDAVRRLVEERDDALRSLLKAEKRCERMRAEVTAARRERDAALARAARLEAILADPGVRTIAAERQRQMAVEGWTPEHDDRHGDQQMVDAAVCYLINAHAEYPDRWPWDWSSWKPKSRLRNLERAGALIAAEISRLKRAADAAAAPAPEEVPGE